VKREPSLKQFERVRASALAMLRAEFARFADDHEDFVQQAMVDALRTCKSDDGFPALVLARARGLALRGAERAARESSQRIEPQNAQQPFVSGKRPLRRTRLEREALDRLGRFFENESGRLADYVASALLFDDDFISAHFGCLGRLIESELGAALPSDFVEKMMAFKDATARLSAAGEVEWSESAETERIEIFGVTAAGRKPGKRRGRLGALPLRGETEFRLKRRDVGRLLAAHALGLCGFHSREIHDLGRREARRESAFHKLWVRRIEEAHDAEPDATDERFLELVLLAVPGGPGAAPQEQPPTRHPAFRRFGRRAK
jgi:hypothetical protein